jgi:hypothetical protein
MKEFCEKCGAKNTGWISGEKYKGLEEHHNPPKFMVETWVGEIYTLCDECHEKLHQKIIIPFLNEKARTLKFNGSEYWLWRKIIPIDRKDVVEKIFWITKKWKEDKNDTNTQTT